MLTKKEVESYKKSAELDDGYASSTMVLNLIGTLESMTEVIKFYAEESYDWDHNGISDEAKDVLAEYEKED